MSHADLLMSALAAVRDPELDTSIVELGFVSECGLDAAGTARVRLRLPTYFCAPNFAYLMVADAHDAIASIEGVTAIDLQLEDHFAAAEINAGVRSRAGFAASFDGLAGGELDDLRRTFLRKAVLAAQERAARALLAAGVPPGELVRRTLADVQPSTDREGLRRRRQALDLPAGDADPLLLDIDGTVVTDVDVPVHLRRARTVRVSMEANADLCRQLLAERYGTPPDRSTHVRTSA